MDPADNLEALRLKIDRIEADLADAKQSLSRLEPKASPVDDVGLPPLLTPPAKVASPEPMPVPLPPRLPVALSAQKRTRPLRDWLTSCHLWPPRDEGNAEVRLAAWWATRLGGLLAVIGVVFFGAYVSRGTSPLVKFGELVAVAFFVGASGLWLERSVPKFGRLIVGMGLALLYFASVAAHAIPATQVIADPLAAMVLQLCVVLLIAGFAVWRREESTATVSILFGFGTVMAGSYAGLDQWILWSAIGLSVVAVALKLKPGWRSPSVLAVPLFYAAYVGHTLLWGDQPDTLSVGACWVPLGAAFGLFLWGDAVPAWKSRRSLESDDQTLQNLNSSLAIAVGWLVTWQLFPDSLETFYFGAAIILGVVAMGWRWLRQTESLGAVAATQSASLLALGLVTHFDGYLICLVLLAQAFALLVASRFLGLKALRWVLAAVWIYSLYAFVDSLDGATQIPFGSALLYLGLSATLWGFAQRWTGLKPKISYLAGALLGLVAWRSVVLWDGTAWSATWLAGVALILLLGSAPSRAWRAGSVAVGLSVLGMFFAVSSYPVRSFAPWQHWTNGAVVIVTVFLVALLWDRLSSQDSKRDRLWRGVLVMGGSLILELIFWKGLRHGQDVACAAATAVVLLSVSPWAKRWPLAIAGVVGLAYGLYLHHPFHVRTDYPMLFLAGALAWVLPVIWQYSPRRVELVRSDRWRRAMPWWQGVLATWILLLGLQSNFAGAELFLMTAVEAVAVFVLAWKLGVRVAWPASTAVLVFGAAWVFQSLIKHAPMSGEALEISAICALAVVLLLLPIAARGFAGDRWRQRVLWGHGMIALVLVYWYFAAQTLPLASYATVLWGGWAISVFALGLFLRERPYRLLGLLGLAVCVPRIFLVDLDSTLNRIIAFVALGLVMLWVGFSYHRFRHLIIEESGDESKEGSE